MSVKDLQIASLTAERDQARVDAQHLAQAYVTLLEPSEDVLERALAYEVPVPPTRAAATCNHPPDAVFLTPCPGCGQSTCWAPDQ